MKIIKNIYTIKKFFSYFNYKNCIKKIKNIDIVLFIKISFKFSEKEKNKL